MAEKRLPGLFETLGYTLPWADRMLAATFDYAPQPGETTPYQSMLSNLGKKNYSGALMDALGVLGGPSQSLTGAGGVGSKVATFIPAGLFSQESLQVAKARNVAGEAAGSGSDIHKTLGVFKDRMGHWLSEISDEGAKLTGVMPSARKGARLGDVLENPELYKYVPKAQDVGVDPIPAWILAKEPRTKGAFDADKNKIYTNLNEGMLGTLIHEPQHFVDFMYSGVGGTGPKRPEVMRKLQSLVNRQTLAALDRGLDPETVFRAAKQVKEDPMSTFKVYEDFWNEYKAREAANRAQLGLFGRTPPLLGKPHFEFWE